MRLDTLPKCTYKEVSQGVKEANWLAFRTRATIGWLFGQQQPKRQTKTDENKRLKTFSSTEQNGHHRKHHLSEFGGACFCQGNRRELKKIV